MKIACLVKFVPNPDNIKYDYEKNVIVRENSRMIINHDDAAALAYGLELKKANVNCCIEVVSMAPVSVLPLARDILRVGVDKFTLLADKMFMGSDTFATAMTIGRYLQNKKYDVILSGSHTMDGGTSHVPPQLAEILGIEQISNITKVLNLDTSQATVEIESEKKINTFKISLPAILSFSNQSGYKMPFVKYADIDLDVDDKIKIISGAELGLAENETGLAGSKTVVKKAYAPEDTRGKTVFVAADKEGVEFVHQFLKDKGYVDG